MARAPALVAELRESLRAILATRDEFVTCSAACDTFLAFGTSIGDVITLESNTCEFLLRLPNLHQGQVQCILVHQGRVITGGADGCVVLYDWMAHHKEVLVQASPSASSLDCITDVCVTPDFNWDDNLGSVYFGTGRGLVTKRSRAALFQFGSSDDVLFDDSASASTMHASSRNLKLPGPSIENIRLVPDDSLVLFTWRGRVHVYSERKNRLVARLQLVDTRGRSYTVRVDGTASGECVDANSNASETLPTTESRADACQLIMLDGGGCAVSHGPYVFLCLVNAESDAPLTVLRHYQAQRDIACMAIIGYALVLFFGADSASHTPHQVAMFDLASMHLIDMFSLPDSPGLPSPAHSPIVNVAMGYATSKRRRNSLSPAQVAAAMAPRDASAATSSASALQSPPSATTPSPVATPFSSGIVTRCYLVLRDAVLVMRPLRTNEQMLWLLQCGAFHAAKHLCASLRRDKELIEVANAYACHLWHAHDHTVAMHVWAEYVLPYSPPAVWALFVERLDAAGKLSLIEKFLPFNDRSLLGPSVYARVLELRLQSREYRQLFICIKQWPVLYSVDRMLRGIAAAIAQNESTTHERKEHAENNSDRDNASDHNECRDDSLDYLYLSLLKLYEFSNQSAEATQTLLLLHDKRSLTSTALAPLVDYIHSHHLWLLFSPSPLPPESLLAARQLSSAESAVGIRSYTALHADRAQCASILAKLIQEDSARTAACLAITPSIEAPHVLSLLEITPPSNLASSVRDIFLTAYASALTSVRYCGSSDTLPPALAVHLPSPTRDTDEDDNDDNDELTRHRHIVAQVSLLLSALHKRNPLTAE